MDANAHARRLQAVKMRELGASYREIGQALGVSRQRAHQLVAEETLPAELVEQHRRARNLARNVRRGLQ